MLPRTREIHMPSGDGYKNGFMIIDQFDTKGAMGTGGVTGSKKVQSQGVSYQLKSSIIDAPLKRRLKAKGTDRENLGEFLASGIARPMFVEESGPEYIPQVFLVYDAIRNRVLVASRYIEGVIGDLDDIIPKKSGSKHIVVSFKKPPPQDQRETGVLYLRDEKYKHLIPEIARGVAISMLFGDHDINPANFVGIRNKNSTRPEGVPDHIARIDFGHAFNDLLNAATRFGGGLSQKNHILDYINRPSIAGFPNPSIPKLWRDFEGLIPSLEMAEAMRDVAGKDYGVGLTKAVADLKQLYGEVNSEQKKHIEHTLLEINKALGRPYKVDTDVDIIEFTMHNIEQRLIMNQRDMKLVADLMELQITIDKRIELGDNYFVDLNDRFYNLAGEAGKLEWIKTQPNETPFVGDLQEFIQYRQQALEISVAGKVLAKSVSQPQAFGSARSKKRSDSIEMDDAVKSHVEMVSSKKPDPKGLGGR